MNYINYVKARDAAWHILLDCYIDKLPVDLNVVCGQLGIVVASYSAAKEYLQKHSLQDTMHNTDGFLLLRPVGDPIIFYDDNTSPERMHFTVAHEIGHLVLGHVHRGQATTINREPSPRDNSEEMQANQFAARLLAPACVLWRMNLHTAHDISRVCGISLQAATFRAKRMKELYARNKFLTSPLERAVYNNFKPFMG